MTTTGALPMVGDCRDLPLPDESVEAVVTDPPYGLNFMNREWDHDVPGPDFWREVKRVMRPGAHLLAWAIPKKAHHLGHALEQSGFMVRDKFMHLFGTGFPKSHRFHKDFDGDGWDGWGTALKPGYEEIWLAMKPTDGTFAENARKHGVAGLNIDGCRLSTSDDTSRPDGKCKYGDEVEESESLRPGFNADEYTSGGHSDGRWPPNAVLSHTRWCIPRGTKRRKLPTHRNPSPKDDPDGLTPFGTGGDDRRDYDYGDEDGMESVEDWDCPPSCPVRQLDEQSGERPSGSRLTGEEPRSDGFSGEVYGGGASRFYYCSKASRSEREAGLDGFEAKVSPSGGHGNEEGDSVSKRLGSQRERVNTHPTVKPIDLCCWLVRLVTRKSHTVLDPFMGSGSVGCAALQERRRYIGVDLNHEYVEIARARLQHWAPKQVDLFKDREGADGDDG